MMLFPLQRHKLKNMLDKYDDLYSLDLFGEKTYGFSLLAPIISSIINPIIAKTFLSITSL